jgi:Ca2+-binding EF-hand superfamily protein
VEIEDLFEQFKSLANSRGGIDKQTFEHCLGPLGVARNLITERLFAFFDQDSNGRIDFSELVCGLSVLCKGTSEEKIKYAFRGYDLDSDGYITQEELFKMFKAYFYLSKEAIKDAIKTVELVMCLTPVTLRGTHPPSFMSRMHSATSTNRARTLSLQPLRKFSPRTNSTVPATARLLIAPPTLRPATRCLLSDPSVKSTTSTPRRVTTLKIATRMRTALP